MASISKSGANWRAQVAIGGVRDSGTFPTKAKAQAWAAHRETELRTQKSTGILTGKTLGNAFTQYGETVSPTKRGEAWEQKRLKFLADVMVGDKRFGDFKLTDLTPAVLGEWRDTRLKVVSGATVNRDMNIISHVLTTARKEWGWMAHSPSSMVRRPPPAPPRERRITEREIELMCLSLGFVEGAPVATKYQLVAIAFLFAIETAMRQGEICGLMPAHIIGRVAHLPQTKNGSKRDVPLSSRAVELLKMLPPTEGPVFGLTASTLSAMFLKVRNRAVDGLNFHDTRHEAITRLSKKLDVLALARMTGHKDIKELMTYYNESAADIAQLLD